FTREALVLAELMTPGIVRYVAHGVAETGALYLVMEWLDGCDLAERLKTGPMSVDESILVIRQAAAALVPAHQRGSVHRDIKPSNLFLAGGDVTELRLVDFGVARLAEAGGPSTQTGLVIGTPGYMAPEQARGDRDVDARADVFSLGCVLFECLTGRAA